MCIFTARRVHANIVRSRSCRDTLRGAALPEVLEAPAQLAAAQGDDRVGPADAPMHPGPLEPRADGHVTPGLHDRRGRTESLRAEGWIPHPPAIRPEIAEAPPDRLPFGRVAAGAVLGCQGGRDLGEVPRVELRVARRRPGGPEIARGAIQH